MIGFCHFKLGIVLGWFKHRKEDYYYRAFIFGRFKAGRNEMFNYSRRQYSIARAQATQVNRLPLPHVINKYELHFSNNEHIARCASIASRRIIEPKHMDVDFYKIVGLWDTLNGLIRVVGWMEFLSLTLSVFECLYWGFLSSLVVDWNAYF